MTLAIVPLALASFLPTAFLNHRHCGDWTGAAAEGPALGQVVPWVGLAGNLINAPLQNLVPPVFPAANAWNEAVVHWFPESFMERMAENFEVRGGRFGVTDIQGEESAGLGLGIMVMLGAGLFFGNRARSPEGWKGRAAWLALWFVLALLAYFSKAGMTTVARHILPYYPFLIAPLLLFPRHVGAVRQRSFLVLAWGAALSTMVMLCITPSRPVLPMAAITRSLEEKFPSQTTSRLALGYEVYRCRADILGPLRDALPQGINAIGLINHSAGPETPLWRPYGSREVRHLRPGTDPKDAPGGAVRHVVVNTDSFRERRGESPEEWLSRLGGTILLRRELRPLVKEPPSDWWLVEVPADSAH
jgi:hypothetical protein